MTRRIFCLGRLAVAALAVVSGVAAAQTWPARPVKLLVATGAGLVTNIIARILADRHHSSRCGIRQTAVFARTDRGQWCFA